MSLYFLYCVRYLFFFVFFLFVWLLLFLMNKDIYSQSYFSFQLPTEMLKQRTKRFDIKFKRLSCSVMAVIMACHMARHIVTMRKRGSAA